MKKLEKIIKNRPTIMGIINLTPDSFSDGGKYNTLEKAIKRANELEKNQADIIDIGGESTGPKSPEVSEQEELERVIPVLKKIRKSTKLPISIDTYKAEVARQALEEGANIINDVTGLRGDKKMPQIIAKYNCPLILMYSKDNSPRTTIQKKRYNNVIQTIKDFLEERINHAKSQGINPQSIIIDPGMGQFISAIPRYSYEIIARLHKLTALGRPILIGMSKKSFLMGDINSRTTKALPLSTIAYLNGARIIRTHNVKETKEFFKSLNI